jgi:hypothetical protein
MWTSWWWMLTSCWWMCFRFLAKSMHIRRRRASQTSWSLSTQPPSTWSLRECRKPKTINNSKLKCASWILVQKSEKNESNSKYLKGSFCSKSIKLKQYWKVCWRNVFRFEKNIKIQFYGTWSSSRLFCIPSLIVFRLVRLDAKTL